MRKILMLSALALVVGAAGLYTPNLVGTRPGSAFSVTSLLAKIPVDTGLPNGSQPQTVGAEVFRVAAAGAAIGANTATATAGAATLSTRIGTVTTESLTTASGASYTLTLTNTLVTASSNVLVEVHNGSNTVLGALQVTSVTPASGSVVVVVTNGGTVPLNGTLRVMFLVAT